MNIKVFKLGECNKGDIVQFLDDWEVSHKENIDIVKYNSAKRSRTKGIVISKTKNKSKVLEFDSIGHHRFDKLLILSSMRNSFLVCKLDYKLETNPISE